ncbi:MAG: hypothetical protein AAF603_10600 [Pseudomonadota bacterium]
MNDSAPKPPPASQNLMVLKGITWGLGVLLLLGMILIAVKITSSEGEKEASLDEGSMQQVVSSALPPLPLRQGEAVVAISAGEGRIFVILENETAVRRIVYTTSSSMDLWQELPTVTAATD